jgi:hypothetical protein
MGCNCGSKSKKNTYVYTSPQGQTKTYNTEVEARAAVIRNQGGSIQSKAA